MLLTDIKLNILTLEETIAHILQHNCTDSRFEESEFELMLHSGIDLGFQK